LIRLAANPRAGFLFGAAVLMEAITSFDSCAAPASLANGYNAARFIRLAEPDSQS